jgi:hypothetical protein
MIDMRLWIDDVRPAPEGYKLITSVAEAKTICCQHLNTNKELNIEEINLDHDAGDYRSMGGDYIELLNWLEEKTHCEDWVINAIFKFHSQNPVGVENMKRVCRSNNWIVFP